MMTMRKDTCFFRVAGFLFGISLPGNIFPERILPPFIPFRTSWDGEEEPLFSIDVSSSSLPADAKCTDGLRVIESMDNDMGHATLSACGDIYCVELRPMSDSSVCGMFSDRRFRTVRIFVDWTDSNAGMALSSMVRIAFSQAVLLHRAVAVHASAVCCDGMAYLFTGKSGTGKSTHSQLWLRHVPGTHLLNDDNPVLKVGDDGVVMAYGSPWSGKTSCYRNEGYPVSGLARLFQSHENRFVPKADVEAFAVLLPGCSVIRKDSLLYGCLCDTLAEMSAKINVGILECRPDYGAVDACRNGLKRHPWPVV